MALNHNIMMVMFALAAYSASPVWAQDDPLEVQQQGDIVYITGGIGKEEGDALRAMRSNL